MALKLPGLVRQGNTFLVRKVVPSDVRDVVGKRELLRSLETGDAKVAAKLHGAIWAEFNNTIAQARGLKVSPLVPPLDTLPAEIALSKWASLITSDPGKWVVPDAKLLQTSPSMLAMISGYQAFFESGDPSVLPDESITPLPPIREMTRRMLILGGLRVTPDHPIIAEMERKAALHIAVAYRYLERERLARSVREIHLDEIGAVDVAGKPPPAPSIKLSDLYGRWRAQLQVADRELGRLDHQQRRLVETIGNLPINHITKAMISEHMALVARFPGRKRSAKLAALEMRDAVEQFETENAARSIGERHEPLTAFTVSEWFSGYQRMFKFAVAHDLMDKNPTEGLKEYVVRGANSTKRRAFSEAEIVKIFGSPLFRGYDPTAPKGSRNRAGSVVTRDAKYWLPIIGLLHGARLTEMAAMPLKDICAAEKGGWYFDLTDRDVKTESSRRIIPIHPQLIDLGFLDHVNSLLESGQKWLFPDLDHEAKVGPGHGFSKWFGRWTGQIGLTDREIAFHSFRHNWVRRARETADVKKEMHDIISGHKGMTVSDNYGRGADITPLARDMAKIRFPELTLKRHIPS